MHLAFPQRKNCTTGAKSKYIPVYLCALQSYRLLHCLSMHQDILFYKTCALKNYIYHYLSTSKYIDFHYHITMLRKFFDMQKTLRLSCTHLDRLARVRHLKLATSTIGLFCCKPIVVLSFVILFSISSTV